LCKSGPDSANQESLFPAALALFGKFCKPLRVEKQGDEARMTQTALPWAEKLSDPLAHDVATVLQRMGGSAHQDIVINCVAALKRQRGESVTHDLKMKIIEVFERYRDFFIRPFGEGSLRWALAPDIA